MARSRRRGRAASQCCYKENGRRCQRNGTGNPALCSTHRLVVIEQVEYEQRTGRGSGLPRDPIADLLESFRRTGKIPIDTIADAAAGVVRNIFARGAGQPPLSTFPDGYTPWFPPMPPPGRAAPPPISDATRQRQAAVLMARQELGFQPREPLAAEQIERRRKELARKHHPDLGSPADAPARADRMAKINAAADLLVAEFNLR